MEHLTLLFRDPTNAERRFIPLLIAECQPPDIIAQFAWIDWRTASEKAYNILLAACQKMQPDTVQAEIKQITKSRMVLNGHTGAVRCVSVTPDGSAAISGSDDRTLKVWDLVTGKCCATLKGHSSIVYCVSITPDGRTAVSGSDDGAMNVWDLTTGECRATLNGHSGTVYCLAITPDGRTAVSGSGDRTLKVWDLTNEKCLATLEGHSDFVYCLAIAPDGCAVVSGSGDRTLKVWDLTSGKCAATLRGHSEFVSCVAITPNGHTVVSGSCDKTLIAWDMFSYKRLAILEGHASDIWAVAITPDGRGIVSGSADRTLRAWDLVAGKCTSILTEHKGVVSGVAISANGHLAVSSSSDGTLRVWELPQSNRVIDESDYARYTSAKVVLVGDTGVGKTGLAMRLREDRWESTESTHEMTVSRLEFPPDAAEPDMKREVWLWDFAGQTDYNLIHQLYMDEAALGVLVFNPQDDNPFERISHWEKALSAATTFEPVKLLVAARCDIGRVAISQEQLNEYIKEHAFASFICTAAKTGEGCQELKDAIARNIPWKNLPWTSTTRLFKTLRDAVLKLTDEKAPLVRLPELHQRLQLMLPAEIISEADLRAIVSVMQVQGFIHPLAFGDFLLLQPAWINRYASVVVRMAREHSDMMGVVFEQQVLEGKLDYKDMFRLAQEDEKILLRGIVQTFLDRSLCLRQETPQGSMLVFPSYFRRDKPDLPEHPNVFVTYSFSGPFEEIYSTLVVRLSYSDSFKTGQLWRNAAEFRTLEDKRIGLAAVRKDEKNSEIIVYFEAEVPDDIKITFIKYIHEHLLSRAQNVLRLRHYVCPNCDEALSQEVIQLRLRAEKTDIICPICEYHVPLLDLIEEKFASNEFLDRVKELDERASINLRNETRELILVGHAFAITAEAGQIFRRIAWDEWGIDGEIEFKDSYGKASGKRIYVQLKHDNCFYHREQDDLVIYSIKKSNLAEYWLSLPYPVMLAVRTSRGNICWMNITDYLKRQGESTREIVFKGEPFTAKNILKLRKRILGDADADARRRARLGERELIIGNLDEAMEQFSAALSIKNDNKEALTGLIEVALRSIHISPKRMESALNNLKERSPDWLAKYLCKNLKLIDVSLAQNLIVRISNVILPLTQISDYNGGFGWQVQMTSIDAIVSERKTQTLAIIAEQLQNDMIQLTANTNELPWGLYSTTIRFLSGGREYWRADVTLSNHEPEIPYIAGPPIRDPSLFFGRNKAMSAVMKLLKDYSVVLLGPRRSGKTSFLYHLEIAARNNWRTLFIDLHGYTVLSSKEIVNNFVGEISRVCLSNNKSKHTYSQLEFKRLLEESDVKNLIIFLDEMAILAEHKEAAYWLRHISKWEKPKIRIVIAGTYADLIKVTSAAMGSGPFNEFEHYEIQEISKQDAVDLLVKPVLGFYRYEANALEELLKLCYGRPFFLNLMAKLALKFVQLEGGRVIRLSHIELARKEAIFMLGSWFEAFLLELDISTRSALPKLIQDHSASLPGVYAETLRSAGLAVGPRSKMQFCPLFIDYWNLMFQKGEGQ